MRDVILTLFVFGMLPYILSRPHVGVLMWSWLSYMNPHRLTWSFAYSMPFAQIVAITLFASLFFSKEKLRFPVNATTVIWIVFLLWMGVTTLFALNPESANAYLIRVVKIQLIALLTLVLITDMDKLNKLLWVIVVSIGFYSFKGGVFTLLTGGDHRVWGPFDSYIEENNALALTTLMILPLMLYLYKTAEVAWIRYGLLAAMFFSALSALGSQSRGAFLAMAAVGLFFWLKSRNKVLSLLLLLALAALGLSFMPESWHQRMATIQTYQEDSSAMGRINAWAYSINVANHRLTGAGFESWSEFTFAIYAPNPEAVHAGHSIFFSVLADHGWLGLLLFLAILWLSWRNLGRIIGQTEHEDPMNLLARMLQVSLIAYMSGGAFLSLSYFDLPWHIFAIIVLLTEFLKQKTPCEQGARSQSFRPRRYGAPAPQSGGQGRS